MPNDPKPNWDPILRKIDSELKLRHSERTIQGSVEFYAELSAHMHAIKLAWRNRVMHVDQIVTEERAKPIFYAVVTFMNYLTASAQKHSSSSEEQFS